MPVPKLSIYTMLRTSEEPMTLAGLIALLHQRVGSRDPLHLFDQIEREHVVKQLNELVNEGRIKTRSMKVTVYEVANDESA